MNKKIILKVTKKQIQDIENGKINRLQIEFDVLQYILKNECYSVELMTGYPDNPVSYHTKIDTVILTEPDEPGWLVFAVDCGTCRHWNKGQCQYRSACDSTYYDYRKGGKS